MNDQNAGMGPRILGEKYVKPGTETTLKDMGFGRRMLDHAPAVATAADLPKAPGVAQEPRHDVMGPATPEDHAQGPVVDPAPSSTTQQPFPVARPEQAPAHEAEKRGYSLDEVRTLVAESPSRIPDLFAAELERPDGPRKTALRTLLKAAESESEPNPQLVNGLTAVMAQVAG